MSVYAEMRAILALGLKPNELKVLMTYRLEMDEATRAVRGKTQEQMREICRLSKSQFSMASTALQELGLIEVEKVSNAAQSVYVHVPNSGSSEIRNTRNSEHEGSEIRNQQVPKSEHPLNTAPVSTAPIGVKGRASANFWANATGHGKHAYDGGVRFDDGVVELVNGTLAMWLERFNGDRKALDLALIQCAGIIQPNSSRPICSQVEAQLARIAGQRHDQDRRYEASKAAKAQAQPSRQAPKPGGVWEALQKRKQAAGVAA